MKIPYKGRGIVFFQKNAEGEFSILLGKRINNPGKGKWSIPGGGFEQKDKNLSETAEREFWEETGLNLNIIFRLPRSAPHQTSSSQYELAEE